MAYYNQPNTFSPDKSELEKLYLVDKKSTWDLSLFYDVTQTRVVNCLKRYGIKTRTYAEASRLTLNGFKEGKEHFLWKGDEVGYQSLHCWVRRHKGTPQVCEYCGETEKKKYEWANKSHKYLRNLNDWIRLCTSCHRLLDNGKIKV